MYSSGANDDRDSRGASLKIIHLTTHARGGAARAAFRLHVGLRELGEESSIYAGTSEGGDFEVWQVPSPARSAGKAVRELRLLVLKRRSARYRAMSDPTADIFSDDRAPLGSRLARLLPDRDVTHLHWVAGLLDYRSSLPRIAQDSPVVWTLHDMNAFTGGCHYDLGCGRHSEHCGKCPVLQSHDPHDPSSRIWQRKRSAFDRVPPDRLHIVAPTRWLASAAAASSLLRRFQISVIPYGLDTDLFSPRDRMSSRNVLGIPKDALVVLLIADHLTNARKGMSFALEALRQIEIPLILLSAGSGELESVRHARVHIGPLANDFLLPVLYSAADLMLLPSQQENQALTMLEAMGCGTPVVGVTAGGTPETVRPGVTGLLAEPKDASGLASAIHTLLTDEDLRRRCSEQSRSAILKDHRLEQQARAYRSIYNFMVETKTTD